MSGRFIWVNKPRGYFDVFDTKYPYEENKPKYLCVIEANRERPDGRFYSKCWNWNDDNYANGWWDDIYGRIPTAKELGYTEEEWREIIEIQLAMRSFPIVIPPKE